jgi:hypothetical protein
MKHKQLSDIRNQKNVFYLCKLTVHSSTLDNHTGQDNDRSNEDSLLTTIVIGKVWCKEDTDERTDGHDSINETKKLRVIQRITEVYVEDILIFSVYRYISILLSYLHPFHMVEACKTFIIEPS